MARPSLCRSASTQRVLVPSAPPIAQPGNPVLTIYINNPKDSDNSTQIQIRYNQRFGAVLLHFCETRGKRFRLEWKFVYWYKDPTPDDPNHEAGSEVKSATKPCDFDEPGMPDGASMTDGSVLEIQEVAWGETHENAENLEGKVARKEVEMEDLQQKCREAFATINYLVAENQRLTDALLRGGSLPGIGDLLIGLQVTLSDPELSDDVEMQEGIDQHAAVSSEGDEQ